ncbi:MAG: FAD-dependent oxidoreductase, partial [Hyphomicrobiales bacterium]|nr:FAD-dependent oxidoreductase [Hyphomicrobiales bacterium]
MTITVYDINRIRPPKVPEGFKDDGQDPHFVAAPCQVACPVGTDAPSYLAYIWEDKPQAAFEAITATNPFSSICGRVCDAPCEPACRRADSDGPVAIRNLKRYVMDQLGKDHHLPAVEVTRKETVAVVGGGPAGLTAAQDLAEAGFEVHVYEMSDRLGGMMVWGIPAFRLPPGIIEEDMDRMLKHCPGIKVHLNTGLDNGVTLDELKQRHDAVLLTIGSWWGKSLNVPGEDHANVIDGVAFLRDVNGGARPKMPETVLVIGGGDVAMDACRAAKRLPGCKDVKILYRRGPEEIPARKEELKGAIEEGIEVIYNTQPVEVIADGNDFALRCVETELGEPDEDGRRRPINVEGSERDIACGMVITAVGQKSESAELDGAGLMDWDRVKTDWDTMRTEDPKVFAAGDGAFGGSTIVMAMMHGHRAAYYVEAELDGINNPLPYRTPYRTRRVPIAQDIKWEVFPRIEQDFHGLGDTPVEFPEIESTYTRDDARNEAARCYRCDAETGSFDYNVRTREDIFVMARAQPEDAALHREVLTKRLKLHETPYDEHHKPALEDLVFLPANLSRLVIDPYRDACRVGVDIAEKIELDLPFLVGGFDDAPEEVRKAIGAAVEQKGSAYVGRKPLGEGSAPWLQLIIDGEDTPDAAADAHIIAFRDGFKPVDVPGEPGKLRGLAVRAGDLEAAIPFALDAGIDVLILDATPGIAGPWPELAGSPDFTVIRDALAILRAMNREEDIDLIYFGGIRTGTDGAKLVGLGAKASIAGVAMGLALGGKIEAGKMAFHGDRTSEERIDAAASLLGALSAEASIMARCTGKTDVQNIEPEDLRAITMA